MIFAEIASGDLRIRRLTDGPEDLSTMARWLSDPRVLEFYEGRDNPFDVAKVRQKFILERLPQEIACLVEYKGRPVGYLQFYPITEEEHQLYGYPISLNVCGMDQFIGEPDLWGQGIGTRMIGLVLHHLFGVMGAERVVLDPVVTNARAIRAYEKCGFRKVKRLPEKEWHEGACRDVWLMEVTPERQRA